MDSRTDQARSYRAAPPPRRARRQATAMVAVALVLLIGAIWAVLALRGGGTKTVSDKVDRLLTFGDLPRNHVDGPVGYPQSPPVGGPHSRQWQNCGFYDAPIPSEQGVHALEHGAVWITYRPDLPDAQVETLRLEADSQKWVLVSPYKGLEAPVVASAWAKQEALSGAADPHLKEFVQRYRLSTEAPEVGAPCTGGAGSPK